MAEIHKLFDEAWKDNEDVLRELATQLDWKARQEARSKAQGLTNELLNLLHRDTLGLGNLTITLGQQEWLPRDVFTALQSALENAHYKVLLHGYIKNAIEGASKTKKKKLSETPDQGAG